MEKKIGNDASDHAIPDNMVQSVNDEVANSDEQASVGDDGFEDDDMDKIMSELEFSESGELKLPPIQKTDPNECVLLSSIIYSNKVVRRIRVVVVRIYPTLFHYLDNRGERTILNEGKMTRKLGNMQPRDVLSKQRIFSVRAVDVAAYNSCDWSTSAVIDIPFSREARISAIIEGDIVEITNLIAVDCIPTKRLSGKKSSKITRFGIQDLVIGNLARQLSLGRHINDSDFNPPFYEFDYVGVVHHVGNTTEFGRQEINCIEEDGQIIDINFPEPLYDWNLENVIIKEKIVCFKNLCCRFGYINATSKTDVTLEPDTDMLKDGFIRLKAHYDLIIKNHFNDSPVIPSTLSTPSVKTLATPTEEFEFVKPLKPAPKKKVTFLDPAKQTTPTEEFDFVKPLKPAPKKKATPAKQTTPTEEVDFLVKPHESAPKKKATPAKQTTPTEEVDFLVKPHESAPKQKATPAKQTTPTEEVDLVKPHESAPKKEVTVLDTGKQTTPTEEVD